MRAEFAPDARVALALKRMRLLIRDLLSARGMNAYAFAKVSGARIPISAAYRYVEEEGHLTTFKASHLEAMCDVLEVGPGEPLECAHARKGTAGVGTRRRRG